MAREYYYLVAGLPDIFLDQERKDFNLVKVKEEMQELMHPDDFELVELLFLEYDNFNFLNFLLKRKQEFNELGKFPPEAYNEFEEYFEKFPKYIKDFYSIHQGKAIEDDESEDLDDFSDEKVEKNPEVRFQELFYRFINRFDNQFVKKWFSFQRDFYNILTALNCRKQGLEIASQMVGGGSLVETLVRSQAPDFGIKKEIDYLENLLQITELSDIIERERRLDFLKWDMADEITTFDYFSIEVILAFYIKAGIVYRWIKLDKKIGAEMFKRLVNDLRKTYELPKEFAQ